MPNILTRWRHRLGFHGWLRFATKKRDDYHYAYDEQCSACGAWREIWEVDDAPWGVRTRSQTSVTIRKAWVYA